MNILEEYHQLIKESLNFFYLEGFLKNPKKKKLKTKNPILEKNYNKKIEPSNLETIKNPILENKYEKKEITKSKNHLEKLKTKNPIEKKLKKSTNTKTFKKDIFLSLEKPTKNDLLYFSKIKELVKEIAPSIISKNILDDKEAKKNANKWKQKTQPLPITILYFKENPREILFLKNLALAIQNYFLPTKLIFLKDLEKENTQNSFLLEKTLKFVIAPESLILNYKPFLKEYRENPLKKEFSLKNSPLFLLPEISVFLKDFTLKKSIWTSLVKTLEKNL